MEAPFGNARFFVLLTVFVEPLVRVEGGGDSSWLILGLFSAGGLGVVPSSGDEEGGDELPESVDGWLVATLEVVFFLFP